MNRPRIGITLDSEPAGGWSKMPWYALRQNYCGAVADVGGLPLPLPHEPELASAYLDGLDGLLVTGGAFDVDPALFGDGTKHATVKTKDRRTAFEYAMVKGAIERDMPILGICGGEQLLNVVLGGTLHQHVPDVFPNGLAHEQPNPRTEPGHAVDVVPAASLLEPGPLSADVRSPVMRSCGPDKLMAENKRPAAFLMGAATQRTNS